MTCASRVRNILANGTVRVMKVRQLVHQLYAKKHLHLQLCHHMKSGPLSPTMYCKYPGPLFYHQYLVILAFLTLFLLCIPFHYSHGQKATFTNPLYNLPAEVEAASKLPIKHPDFEPLEAFPPKRFFLARSKRKSRDCSQDSIFHPFTPVPLSLQSQRTLQLRQRCNVHHGESTCLQTVSLSPPRQHQIDYTSPTID